tara:strand:+ start:176 stop:493 length:318 start_codon:yes stop_codon:yes gene_type:complete
MELKEFVTTALQDIEAGVHNANANANREISFTGNKDNPTVTFDIAVTAEESIKGGAEAGIKVLSIGRVSGEAGVVKKNASVSRITFNVDIRPYTKDRPRRSSRVI